MTLLSDDTVRALAGFRSDAAPVTTCYLDVDGRRLPTHGDVCREFSVLVKRAGLHRNGRSGSPPSVSADLGRMEQYVNGLSRGAVRGLAMFSCTEQGFWEVHELPVRVTNQLVVEPLPCVRQLEAVLEEQQPIGVLLVDRQRARMFVFRLGELVEHTEQFDRRERHGEDDRGDLVKTRVASQLSEQAHQHLKRAAGLAFDVHQRVGFDHLVLATTAGVQPDLEHLLHPYLRERLTDSIDLAVSASSGQVRDAAMLVGERIERRTEAALVTQMRELVSSRGRAVAGLKPTLRALGEHKVDRLFVSAGYEAEGWRCPSCAGLATIGPRCGGCGAAMEKVSDVVEVAVAAALAQHGRVQVCVGNADLDVLGCIGATLRYS